MTIDQFFVVAAKSKDLRSGRVGKRNYNPLQLRTDEQGYVKGRTADGKPMKARVMGKSLAQKVLEEEQEKQMKAKRKQARLERRRRRQRGH